VFQTPIIMKLLVAVTVLLVTFEFASSAPWKEKEAEVVLQDIKTLIALAEKSNSLHESQAETAAQSNPLGSLGAYAQQIPPATPATSSQPPSTPATSGQPPATPATSGQPPATPATSGQPPATPTPSGRPSSKTNCFPLTIDCHICVERSGRFFIICRQD